MTAEIGFPSREALGPLIAAAGLFVETWLGDWTGAPFGPGNPEFVPVGGLA